MWLFNKKKEEEKFVFDYNKQNFVSANILKNHLFSGNIVNDSGSFLIVSSYDMYGNKLKVSTSLDDFASLNSFENSLKFSSFSNSVDNILLKSQWFARVNYNEPISIVNHKNREYELRMTHQEKNNPNAYDCIIRNNIDKRGLWGAGPFQLDKLSQDRLLVSSVSANELDALIRESYKLSLHERF